MAILGTTVLDSAVQTLFDADYMLAASLQQVYDQFSNKRQEMNGERGGTYAFDIYGLLSPSTTALPASADITANTFTDEQITIALSEYGDAVILPRFLEARAYTNIHRAASEVVAQSFADSTELIARSVYIGGDRTYRPAGIVRASLDYTNASHRISFQHMVNLYVKAQALRQPAFEDGTYATVVSPALVSDFARDALWQNVGAYSKNDMIFDGTPGSLAAGARFIGEQGKLANIRVCVSPWGKLYHGGGLTAQSATTLSASAAAGATQVVVGSATGIVAGDWITLMGGATGVTLEADGTETAQVTSVNGGSLDIVGFGNTEGNTGLRSAKVSGASVQEATQVGAVPLIGPKSVGKIFSSDTGEKGLIQTEYLATTIPRRFTSISWLIYAGWGRLAARYLIRGEFGIVEPVYGYYEG